MEFDVTRALRRATGRAKSDVANKLVSMLLHEVSRRACQAGGLGVSDIRYTDSVVTAFRNSCIYCDQPLERDRTAVEHLNGMNRFRLGLHLPGNVALACRVCNTEKRRDDQRVELTLAATGWESFLTHDGTRCEANCKTCNYWASVWTEEFERRDRLQAAVSRIQDFQAPYRPFVAWAAEKAPILRERVEALYRECQQFATERLGTFTSSMDFDYEALANGGQATD